MTKGAPHESVYKNDMELYYKEKNMPIRYYHFDYPKDIKNFLSHWHEEIEITYIEDGVGQYSIDMTDYEVCKGDIVIIKPNIIHAGEMKHGEVFTTNVYVFDVSTICHSSFINDINTFITPIKRGEVDIPPIIKPGDNMYDELKQCLMNIKECITDKKLAYELEVKEYLLHFFVLLYRGSYIKRNNISQLYHKNEYNIKKAINYIEKNYKNKITIDELAKISGFSTCYFMNIFKKYTGISCVTFINHFRLDIAAQKLVDTDEPVLNIALSCGFNNISFFNRAFKKYFDKTPKEYRISPCAKIVQTQIVE